MIEFNVKRIPKRHNCHSLAITPRITMSCSMTVPDGKRMTHDKAYDGLWFCHYQWFITQTCHSMPISEHVTQLACGIIPIIYKFLQATNPSRFLGLKRPQPGPMPMPRLGMFEIPRHCGCHQPRCTCHRGTIENLKENDMGGHPLGTSWILFSKRQKAQKCPEPTWVLHCFTPRDTLLSTLTIVSGIRIDGV